MKTENQIIKEVIEYSDSDTFQHYFKNHCILAMRKYKYQYLDEIKKRIETIKSEPNGLVRETMIENLLIDL